MTETTRRKAILYIPELNTLDCYLLVFAFAFADMAIRQYKIRPGDVAGDRYLLNRLKTLGSPQQLTCPADVAHL